VRAISYIVIVAIGAFIIDGIIPGGIANITPAIRGEFG